jgi:hypothetical protein
MNQEVQDANRLIDMAITLTVNVADRSVTLICMWAQLPDILLVPFLSPSRRSVTI